MWLEITLIYKIGSNKNVLQFNTLLSLMMFFSIQYDIAFLLRFLFFQQIITNRYTRDFFNLVRKQFQSWYSPLLSPDEHLHAILIIKAPYQSSLIQPGFRTAHLLHLYIFINRTSACPSAFGNFISTAVMCNYLKCLQYCAAPPPPFFLLSCFCVQRKLVQEFGI